MLVDKKEFLNLEVNLFHWSCGASNPITETKYTVEEIMQLFNIEEFSLDEAKKEYFEWISYEIDDVELIYNQPTFRYYLENNYNIDYEEFRNNNVFDGLYYMKGTDIGMIVKAYKEDIIEVLNELLRYEGTVTHPTGVKNQFTVEFAKRNTVVEKRTGNDKEVLYNFGTEFKSDYLLRGCFVECLEIIINNTPPEKNNKDSDFYLKLEKNNMGGYSYKHNDGSIYSIY